MSRQQQDYTVVRSPPLIEHCSRWTVIEKAEISEPNNFLPPKQEISVNHLKLG